ncbi:MAG: hypothetical protein IJK76_01545 [Bacteroidales bacterium]|nr:hypothetical protein [Bacteroidales bacterium]
MRKEILNQLKTRFSKYGLSDSILEKIAAWLEPSVKEEKDIETAISGVEPVLSLFQSGEDAHRQEKLSLEQRIKELEKQVPKKQTGEEDDDDDDKPLTKKDIASLIAEAIKPVKESLDNRAAEDKAAKRRSDILAKAKEYQIPDAIAEMLTVPEDADLDTFMKDKKQVLADNGFAFVEPPKSAEQVVKTENASIAEMISKGTKAIVEPSKS